MSEPLIGTTKAAPIAGADPSTLRRACAAGEVEGAQLIGKSWAAPEASWIKWKNTPEYHKTGKQSRKKARKGKVDHE